MRVPALGLLLTLTALPAQRPSTWRCRHVLAEDAASWRDDMVVVTLLSDIIEVRPARADETVDRDFGEAWMVPGLIDLHTHLLLRPYDQISWDDQVRKESHGLRLLRATQHARDTLLAGFVAIRDLGTEGAGFVDVDLRQALREGWCRGPELFPATRAIVKRGFYGPDVDDPTKPKGAEVVDDEPSLRAAVVAQARGGAAWIKVYADYRRGTAGAAEPAFSLAELRALCEEAGRAGLPVAAHATTDEGIARAVQAGVRTIEHGAGASEATLRLMRERDVVLCPCLAANEAIVRYAGHRGPMLERLNLAKLGFQRALAAGVTIACGSDAGVFAHGTNGHELELMVAYGMPSRQALQAATTIAAKVLGNERLGAIRAGARCGLVVLGGDPLQDIGHVRTPRAVVRESDELGR